MLYFWLLWSFTLTNSMNSIMAASSNRIMLGPLVAAIDQGTSSTRFLVSGILRTCHLVVVEFTEVARIHPENGESSVPLPTCAAGR